MKKNYLINIFVMAALVFTMTGCETDRNKITVQEPGKTTAIVDESEQEESEPEILVDKIEHLEQVTISDWFDDDTVIVSKDNESLDKMSLAELSDQYPKSLYLLNINSKEYQLVKEKKDVLLGGAVFSKDRKYMIYDEYVLGDPAYFIMNMENHESIGLMGEPIGGAKSAHWADNETVIGAAYSGGVYLADRTGNMSLIDELKDEGIYLVEKLGNNIYYNTQSDFTLMNLNLATKEKNDLNLEQVSDILPSPDHKQMIILQNNGSKSSMIIYSLDHDEKITIAENAELSGVSWSPDQKMIAYGIKEDNDNSTGRSLYVYDIPTGKSIKIAANTETISTNWSPSGKKLSYTEWDEEQSASSIVYFK
jgi:TolB protein